MSETKLRILLLDDEESLREPLQKYLRMNFDYEVDATGDSRNALDLVRESQGHYDVALIDQSLVAGSDGVARDGVEVMREIKESYPDIECIILTGWGTEVRQKALEGGAFRYIEKPYDNDELAMLVRAAAQQVRQREISKAILTELDRAQALLLIKRAAQSLSGADEAALVLLNPMTGKLELDDTPFREPWRRHFAQRSLSHDIIDTNRAASFSDLETTSDLDPAFAVAGYRSFVGVPVPGRNATLGVLYVYSKAKWHFDQWGRIAILRTLAGQAGLAIANAEAYKQLRSHADLQQSLVRVSGALTLVTNEAEQLDLAWNWVRQELGVSTFFVALYDEETDTVRYPIFYDEDVLQDIPTDQLGDDPAMWGITGYAVKKGLELNWNTPEEKAVQCQSHGIKPRVHGKSCRSCLYLPIRSGTKVIGTLSVQAYQDLAFSPVDLFALRALCGQLSAALDNGRRLAETRRREELLDQLDRGLAKLRGETDPSVLQHQVVRLAAQLTHCDVACWLGHRGHLGELEVVSVHELPVELLGRYISSDEGLVGEVARSGKSKVVANDAECLGRKTLLGGVPYMAAAVPLQVAGVVEGVLFVAWTKRDNQLNPSDLEVLERFASQAVLIQHTAQLLSHEQRVTDRLVILHQISDYIQDTHELEMKLHVVLTGITASYGLGLNRAALFLMDGERHQLVGRLGIGPMTQAQADEIWNNPEARKRDNFREYLSLLDAGQLPSTPVDTCIRGLVLPVASDTMLERILNGENCCQFTDSDLESLPLDLRDAFQPSTPLLAVPLKAGGQAIGLLLADNKFTRAPLAPDVLEAVLTFVNTAAVAIQNSQLLHEAVEGRSQLRLLFAAGNQLVSAAGKRDDILQDIVERGREAAKADSVSMVLLDQAGNVLGSPITAGEDQPIKPEDLIRKDGLSMRVMNRQAEYEKIEDANLEEKRVNPSFRRRGLLAGLCLPVDVQNERLGVVWFHYRSPRRFSPAEIEANRFYVNQAALAYDDARRLEALERLRKAAIDLAGAANVARVREKIVEHVCRVMDAKAALLWPYDDARDHFLVEQFASHGFDEVFAARFKNHSPRPDGVTELVLKKGWHDVHSVRDAAELDPERHALLLEAGIHSVRGQSLVVGDEKLGVFYTYHDRQRQFSQWETDTMRSLSAHAALALKKERLVEQRDRTRTAIQSVLEATALGELNHVLNATVNELRDVLKCDVVTLYAYDTEHKEFILPPAMIGAQDETAARSRSSVARDSIVYRVFELGEPLVASDVLTEPFFATSRFARTENIQSAVAMSLRTREGKVGVLFVNYCSPHVFVSQELADIDLFAYQAAIAIRNALLYRKTKRQTEALEALNTAGKAITGALELQETLDRIVRQALVLVGSDQDEGCFSHLSLKTGNYLRFTAASEPNILERFRSEHGDIDLHAERIGITGRVAKTRTSLNVGDVHQYEASGQSYIRLDSHTRSELCVPILIGSRVIGVINVEHPQYRAFSNEDREALESLAATAAIAIQNARLYEQQLIVSEISRDTARQLDLPAFMEALFSKLVTIFEKRRVDVFPSLATYDAKTEVLETYLTHYYRAEPETKKRRLDDKGLIPLVARQSNLGWHYAPDVNRDPDYLPLRDGTNSEIAVRITYGGKLLGVLDVESSLVDPFEPEDVRLLVTLADQMATTLNAIQQHKDLKEAERLAEARTALAGLGMVGSVFRHTTDANAQKIEEASQWVRKELAKARVDAQAAADWLDMIERAAKQLKEKPIIPPLRSEEGVTSLGVNGFLRQRVERMWDSEPYRSCGVVLNLYLKDSATVRASEQWLRCVVEILLDNAVNAMAGIGQPCIIVGSCERAECALITVTDNGRGIPDEVRDVLFHYRVDKQQGDTGLGVGLLMAKMIVETYRGEIYLDKTGPKGTTMAISLPLEVEVVAAH